MSLGGIAIAMGELVDAAIVVVEQTHKKLEEHSRRASLSITGAVVIEAVKEVAPASFFALLVIAVSFLPVLTLEAQEGRLFKPLAYTKTLAMIVAACLAITLDPALRLALHALCAGSSSGRHGCAGPPISCSSATSTPRTSIPSAAPQPSLRAGRALVVALEVDGHRRRRRAQPRDRAGVLQARSEFMPPLDEGALFYMPTTMPGISITEAQTLLQVSDRIIRQFPEVDRVLGKAGRADTSTDPAPLSMLETVHHAQAEIRMAARADVVLRLGAGVAEPIFRPFTPDHVSTEELVNQLNEALKLPGVSNAWTMPIKARIDMLTTGIRTPLGLKISGDDLQTIEDIAHKWRQRSQPFVERVTCSPSGRAAASSSMSSGIVTSWRVTASAWTRRRRSCRAPSAART